MTDIEPTSRALQIRDCFLTYIRSDEAWYARANAITHPTLSVGLSHPGGGVDWEFEVVEHDFGRRDVAIKLAIFDDAFQAFEDIPWFFTALRVREMTTVLQVQELLSMSGAADRTQRVRYEKVWPHV